MFLCSVVIHRQNVTYKYFYVALKTTHVRTIKKQTSGPI